MTSPTPSAARDMARVLLAGLIDENDAPKDAAAAVQRVWARTSERLRRAVGDAGYDALLTRALHRTQAQHPALLDACRAVRGATRLDAVEAAAEKHGFPAVRDAVEALLSEVIDILSGLIGTEMVQNLLENDGTPSHGL
jgi:hypothetical protein